MVMRSTNHIILIRNHSYDLLTWSQHEIYKLHPDIKLSSISTSMLSLLCYDYIRVSHLSRLHYFYISVFSSLQHVSLAYCGPQAGAWRFTRKITSRSTPIQILVVVAWEKLSWSLLIKATNGGHGEWWAGWLARYNISPTLKDINISFNHLPYYSISRDNSKVVTDKR